MLPGCNCCEPCYGCCNNDAPAEFEVDITLSDDLCGTCDSYVSGTYTLSRIPYSCAWYYEEGSRDCDADSLDSCSSSDWFISYRRVELRINCFLDDDNVWRYSIIVNLWLGGRGPYHSPPEPGDMETCGGANDGYFRNSYQWSVEVDADGFACSAVANLEVPPEMLPPDFVDVSPAGYECCDGLSGPLPEYFLCDDTPGSVYLSAV